MCKDMLQLVLFNQIPSSFYLHAHFFLGHRSAGFNGQSVFL
jgi:hypothetical protein